MYDRFHLSQMDLCNTLYHANLMVHITGHWRW